jgi:hypothetical protein
MKIEKSIYAWPKNIQGEDIQTLIQLIDINDALHFELIWTGDEWIDCPGELFEQALIKGMPGAENWTTAPKENFVDLLFPGALEPRFNAEQQKEIMNFLKMDLVDRVTRIAELIHAEQVDLVGRPLIRHIVRSSPAMVPTFAQMSLDDQTSMYYASNLQLALDHPGSAHWPKVLPSDLAEWGVPRDALAIIEILTKNYSLIKYLGQDRDQTSYLAAVAANPMARLVKIAQAVDDANRQRILWMNQMGVTPSPSADEIYETLDAMDLSDEELDWSQERANDSCELLPEGFFDKNPEEWLNEFRIKFGKLFDAFDRGNPDEVAIEIELLYLDYKYVKSIREMFYGFLRSSAQYLRRVGKMDVVERILEDIPPYVGSITLGGPDTPEVTVEEELAMIKALRPRQQHPIQELRIEEDWPEIDEEKK